jgi:hypothetical protein
VSDLFDRRRFTHQRLQLIWGTESLRSVALSTTKNVVAVARIADATDWLRRKLKTENKERVGGTLFRQQYNNGRRQGHDLFALTGV